MNISHRSALLILLIALLIPLSTMAAFTRPSGSDGQPFGLNENTLPDGPDSITELISVIADWFFTILIVLAVIFMLIAAFNYMGGSEEGVQKAHRMLLYTAVAVAVAFLSIGIVTAIQALVDK